MVAVQISVTAGEISSHGNWEAFCEGEGIGYWAMNEGQLDSSETFQLTTDKVIQYGLRSYVLRQLQRPGEIIEQW